MRKKQLNHTSFLTLIFVVCLPIVYQTHLQIIYADVNSKTPPFRETKYPVTQTPSQIVLNLTQSPSTSISISWSTSTNISHSVVEWKEANKTEVYTSQANAKTITDPFLINNPEIFRWHLTLNNLKPNTLYEYRVGSPENNMWSDWFKFKTAPKDLQKFSFIYLGDAQNGFEQWSKLLKEAIKKCEDCSFIMMAGDLVNRGNERDDWDDFFYNADNIFARYPLIPTIGNHEYKSSKDMLPQMYLDYFVLPENGPKNITPEFCYFFEYSNAKFIILNANLNPVLQKDWLEDQLKNTPSIWKFLMFHQPIYSSAPRRDNKHIRDAWLPIIDNHQVDIVFQGHDHSYWRTYPLKNGEVSSNPTDGTIYIISFSGTKAYDQQEPLPTIATAFAKIPTYQIITIETKPENKLTYRAYDIHNNIKDEFTIKKDNHISWKPQQNTLIIGKYNLPSYSKLVKIPTE